MRTGSPPPRVWPRSSREQPVLDRERLIKVLAMTTSPNDSEALSAMRKANEIIRAENLTWAEVLAQHLNLQGQPLGQSAHTVHVDLFRRGGFASPEFYKDGEEWRIRVKR